MLPCSQRALILVLEHMGNFGVRLPPGCMACEYIVSAFKCYAFMPQDDQYFQNVASMLCCHCWMFSLSDPLPMQSYPSNVWVLCQCGRAAQRICLVSYRSLFLHEIGGILWLTL